MKTGERCLGSVTALCWLTSDLRGVQTLWFKVILNSNPWLLPSELLLGKFLLQSNAVFSPGKSHGWRSLVGCSPWGRKELDTTGRPHYFTFLCSGRPGKLCHPSLVAGSPSLSSLASWTLWPHCLICSTGLSGLFHHTAPMEPHAHGYKDLSSLTSPHLPRLAEGHCWTSRIPPSCGEVREEHVSFAWSQMCHLTSPSALSQAPLLLDCSRLSCMLDT